MGYRETIDYYRSRFCDANKNVIVEVDQNGDCHVLESPPSNLYINFLGIGNLVVYHRATKFTKCTVDIRNNNFIYFGKTRFDIYKLNIKAPQCQDGIIFFDDSFSCWSTTLRPSYKSSIIVGKDCQFSYGITIWTSDGHAIFDSNGKLLNPDKDTIIGNHVWVGHAVEILKGVQIPDGCVIGAGALVTKSFTEKNSIIAGTPASIIKTNIRWERMSPHHFYGK